METPLCDQADARIVSSLKPNSAAGGVYGSARISWVTFLSSFESLQLEGAVFVGVDYRDGLIAIQITGAELYREDTVEELTAAICLVRGEVAGNVPAPGVIEEVALQARGVGSWHVFVPMPFTLSGFCSVELLLASGDSLRVAGDGVYVEHGPLSVSYPLTPTEDCT